MPLYTVQEAAEQLGKTSAAVLKAIQRRQIRARRMGARYVLDAEAIEVLRVRKRGRPRKNVLAEAGEA